MTTKTFNLQDETFLKTDQVADLLQVSSQTVKAWRAKNIGPKAYKFGGAVRYDKFEILKKISNE